MPETQRHEQNEQSGEQSTHGAAFVKCPPSKNRRCRRHQPTAPRKYHAPTGTSEFTDIQRPASERLVECRRAPAVDDQGQRENSKKHRQRLQADAKPSRDKPRSQHRAEQHRRLEQRDPQRQSPSRRRDIAPARFVFSPNPHLRRQRHGDQEHEERLVVRPPQLEPMRQNRRHGGHQSHRPPMRPFRHQPPDHQKKYRCYSQRWRDPSACEFEMTRGEGRERGGHPRD